MNLIGLVMRSMAALPRVPLYRQRMKKSIWRGSGYARCQSRYNPHQGTRERARRLRQLEKMR